MEQRTDGLTLEYLLERICKIDEALATLESRVEFLYSELDTLQDDVFLIRSET